jgi:glutathione S-transferase
LSSLQIYVGDEAFATGPQITLADCELAPALFMLPKVATAYGKPALLEAYPSIGHYVARCCRHPAIRRVLDEMAPTWELRETA